MLINFHGVNHVLLQATILKIEVHSVLFSRAPLCSASRNTCWSQRQTKKGPSNREPAHTVTRLPLDFSRCTPLSAPSTCLDQQRSGFLEQMP